MEIAGTQRVAGLLARVDVPAWATGGMAGVLATVPAAAQGGYFPDTYSWLAALTFCVAALVLLAGRARTPGFGEVAFLGGLAAFAGWAAITLLWTPVNAVGFGDLQRLLAYLGVVLLVAVTLRRPASTALLYGALTGVAVVGAYALLTRLLPGSLGALEGVGGYRLSEPIGYGNGLGLYAALGILLAVGLAARAATVATATLVAVPIVPLSCAMYFTSSHSAWVALAAGWLATVAVDPRRLKYLLMSVGLGAWPAIAIWVASNQEALTTPGATLGDARSQGRVLLVIVVVLSLACVAVAAAIVDTEPKVAPTRTQRQAFVCVVALASVAIVMALVVVNGGPATVADAARTSFRTGPATAASDGRPVAVSANGRLEQWRVSWDDFAAHPVAGRGAGSYPASWAERRPHDFSVLNAHSLYLETLGALGLVGLLLLLVALAIPVWVASTDARRSSILPAAFSVWVALLVHAAVDWTWQLTGVTVVGLLAAATLLAESRKGRRPLTPRLGTVLTTAAVAGMALALVSVLGNVPLARAEKALGDLRFANAVTSAETARRWQPWSSEPLRIIGEARIAEGRDADARAILLEATRKDPEQWELWLDLALASRGADRAAALARAKELNPLSGEVAQLSGGG